MLSEEELNKIAEEVASMPSTNSLKTYNHSVFEVLAARLASKVIHRAESLGERLIQSIAAKGKKFMDKQLRREAMILELPVPFDSMEALAAKNVRIRKELGLYDSTKFLDVFINMKDFCREFADYGDSNMMELRLRKCDAGYIAAYFFRPVFYWDLFKTLFTK